MENPLVAVRYAFRQFRSSPVFTAAAVLTLALGIGGTTAIFTLIHAVMIRSLPVADPSALYHSGASPGLRHVPGQVFATLSAAENEYLKPFRLRRERPLRERRSQPFEPL